MSTATLDTPIVDPNDEVTQTAPPSHILQDGRFVYLPEPTPKEHIQFFERSIARHGLLEEDMGNKKEEEDTKEQQKRKVHPLALASARLQGDGINELNRAINLSNLVSTGDYFGMSNIVDPSLEVAAVASATDNTPAKSEPVAGSAPPTTKALDSTALEEMQEKAIFVLKRKRIQFEKASGVLSRHRRRIAAAIVAQNRPDARLRQLRSQWRLCAPEHGTRALPHAARPTEIVACDVDLYHNNSTTGRIASRVPRYATMELREDYSLQDDLNKTIDNNDAMDVDVPVVDEQIWTRAEPFSIADPTLGKLDADFDPKKIAMLSLEFMISKDSTGFQSSVILEPIATAGNASTTSSPPQDETVLAALQHSLFCAKLFESIRRELAPDTEDVGNTRISLSSHQSVVWLSDVSAVNFLSPPMQQMDNELSVIHVHEGQVKVQLDCEYNLRVRLVEAGSEEATKESKGNSGSQTPEQLRLLCRSLLLHAQEKYHSHSLSSGEKEKPKEDTHLRKKQVESPHILQSCVHLGSKLLLERRIRKTLSNVKHWLASTTTSNETLEVEWLSLSVFDMTAQFTIVFRSTVFDCCLTGEEITVTTTTHHEDYRKVKFHSDAEFEIFLKLAIQRLLREE
jgi:hypothetical protein